MRTSTGSGCWRTSIRTATGASSATSCDRIPVATASCRPTRCRTNRARSGGIRSEGSSIVTSMTAGGPRSTCICRRFAISPMRASSPPTVSAFGGTQSLGTTRVWKVDFRPDEQIRVPDVEGSIYLDSTRLIVRRAVFRMTKPEAAKTPIQGLSVTATYREVAPLIPVVDSIITDQPLMSAGESFRVNRSSAPRSKRRGSSTTRSSRGRRMGRRWRWAVRCGIRHIPHGIPRRRAPSWRAECCSRMGYRWGMRWWGCWGRPTAPSRTVMAISCCA